MTSVLRLAMPPAEIEAAESARPRPSWRVAKVMEVLDCDRSHVSRLLKDKSLQGYKLGARGVRIYVDSVKAYQERQAAGGPPAAGAPTPRSANRAASARQAEAEAYLRRLGVM